MIVPVMVLKRLNADGTEHFLVCLFMNQQSKLLDELPPSDGDECNKGWVSDTAHLSFLKRLKKPSPRTRIVMWNQNLN